VRYGLVLGGLRHIPGRVLRLGQRFDFIAALPSELSGGERERFGQLMREEAAASVDLIQVLFGKRKPTLFRKRLVVAYPNGA
jgi:hypothetical protein